MEFCFKVYSHPSGRWRNNNPGAFCIVCRRIGVVWRGYLSVWYVWRQVDVAATAQTHNIVAQIEELE